LKTGGTSNVFKFPVVGPEQSRDGFDATTLQPVVRNHAGLASEYEEHMGAATSGFFRHFVHGQRFGEMVFNVFHRKGQGIGGAALSGVAGVPGDFYHDHGNGQPDCGDAVCYAR